MGRKDGNGYDYIPPAYLDGVCLPAPISLLAGWPGEGNAPYLPSPPFPLELPSAPSLLAATESQTG
jgi:hypothetical protein